ncbi:LacI family DNA-binding transcriptional regulator [Virgibacillus sp. W0430]|uniref:LacI family DNA-binding transcriptional regulator n=1 Tax=Virgibacillus sp. W0430 TaxID=3391580 RepID=UPI003F4801D8
MRGKVTISHVAREAGVSKSTVSQFLNARYDYMSEETKKRIEKTIIELNYQPNAIARSLKTKNTATIGVIVANILHTYSTQVIRSIENVCHERRISTIICNADNDPEKELNYIETLLSKQVDGLIVIPMKENAKEYRRLINQKYPIIFLDRLLDEVENESILLNNELASELAVDHLLENKYDKIAIMTTPLNANITPRLERVRGYENALRKHRIPVDTQYIKSVPVNRMQKELENLFKLTIPPNAIISGNDLTLVEILSFIKQNEYVLGKEIGLVTIDEVPYASLFTPSITTIMQPTFEMGKKAAELLLDKIEKKSNLSREIYRFKPSLIVRNSSIK